MKKRKILSVICISLSVLILVVLVAGCGAAPTGKYYASSSSEAYQSSAPAFAPYEDGGDMKYVDDEYISNGETDIPGSSGTDVPEIESRKLIKTQNISVETKEFDKFISSVNASVSEYGGYFEQSELSDGATSSRQMYMLIRVPEDRLNELSSKISELGTVTSKAESTEDVTLQYLDIESRIKSLRTEQDTLFGLLEKAETLDDTIRIQDRLTDVRYEIEYYESQMRTMQNMVSYATIRLHIYEVERETPNEKGSVWSEIGNNLSNGMYNIGQFFRSFFIYFVSALPYLIIIAAIVFVILLFTVFIPRSKKKKAVKKQQEAMKTYEQNKE